MVSFLFALPEFTHLNGAVRISLYLWQASTHGRGRPLVRVKSNSVCRTVWRCGDLSSPSSSRLCLLCPSPIRSSCGRLTSPFPGPIRRGDAWSVASNPPVPSLQNLSCLISLMMDFKSNGWTRNPRERMQMPVRAHARTRGIKGKRVRYVAGASRSTVDLTHQCVKSPSQLFA